MSTTKITTDAYYQWSARQNRYLLLRENSINWKGPLAFCKGASQQQNDLAASQTQFYNTLQTDQASQFANQQNVLTSLQNTLNPIAQAGPNQYGFNTAETNNLNSSVINNTAQQYAGASRALGQQQGAAGGGNSLLPSGVQSQQQAALAASAANQTASGLTGVQQAGYQQGNNMYNNAVGQLGGVAGQYGSGATSYAGSANNAGTDAGNELNTIYNENEASNPWSVVGGLLGGAASAGLGAFTGGLGAGAAKSVLGCWIAAELYGGWDDSRTVLARNWIFGNRSVVVRFFAKVYLKFGRSIAEHIKTHATSRWFFQKVFDWVLRKAEEDKNGK